MEKNQKCICGHVETSHSSSKYGSDPRSYSNCRKCTCKRFQTLEDVEKMEAFYTASIKTMEKEIEKLREDYDVLNTAFKIIRRKHDENVCVKIPKLEGQLKSAKGQIADICSCAKAFPFLEFKEPVDEANFRKWFAELVFLVGEGRQKTRPYEDIAKECGLRGQKKEGKYDWLADKLYEDTPKEQIADLQELSKEQKKAPLSPPRREEHSPLCRVMKNLFPEKEEKKEVPKK